MEEKNRGEHSLPPVVVTLGAALRQLRSSRDLTQTELSRRSKVKRSQISEYEADKTVPDASTLARLLKALDYKWGGIDRAKSFLAVLATEEIAPVPFDPGSNRKTLLQAAAEEVSAVGLQAADLLRAIGRIGDLLAHLRDASPDSLEAIKKKDRALAVKLFAELRSLPFKTQRQRIREETGFANWALCELLCLESQRACTRDLAQAAILADLAVVVAEQIKDDEVWMEKLLGFAHAHVANVLRVKSDFKAATRTFRKAREHWEAGGSSHHGYLEEGLLDALEASLLRDEQKFAETLALLECAAANATGKRLRVQVAVSRAMLYHDTGELERAVLTLEEISEEDFPTDDDRLVLCIRHNRADYLSKLDRFEEARSLLPGVQALSRRVGGDLDHARLLWTEGRVVAGFGDASGAIERLTKVRGQFASRNMDFDTALVSLEMGLFYAKENKTEEVKTLARHMVPIFQSKEVHREALAALLLFRQAAELGRATEEFVRSVLVYLRKARYQPELKFEVQAA
jgi:transcriptional regulator with XRE-family HTH domain